MKASALFVLLSLTTIALAGCLSDDGLTGDINGGTASGRPLATASYAIHTLPAVYQDPLGLYEPTIDVGPEGNLYVSAHSTGVGDGPAPAYFSVDDGVTWESMGLFFGMEQAEPDEQGSAPLLSDEVFIVAGEEGMAWGMDCCGKLVYTQREATGPVTGADPTGATGTALGVGGLLIPDSELPLVGWCANGAEVCYYNQNAMDHSAFVATAAPDCVPYYGTDRPWLAYANGKLLLVNNPGTSLSALGSGLSQGNVPAPATGPIPLQVGAMDVPPLTPLAYNAAAWGIQWNLCGSSGGFIPGIPDMRNDHFFAAPQWVGYGNCMSETSRYDVVTGNAADVTAVTQTTAFYNTHVAPAESDSTPSQVGLYGQASFDANGDLFVGAMNNTAIVEVNEEGNERCVAHPTGGGIRFGYSNDDGATFTETRFDFDRPVSSFYMDGNRKGDGFLLNWGEIDGDHTDWFLGHVFANPDGTLRLDNVMLAVDNGPESSRHVQGAALGPDGRAYMVFSYHAQNPGASDRASPGDTPMNVAVQQDGPTMPIA